MSSLQLGIWEFGRHALREVHLSQNMYCSSKKIYVNVWIAQTICLALNSKEKKSFQASRQLVQFWGVQ